MKDFKLSHIHRIRLKSKKYRYVAEIFEDHVSEIQSERQRTAKKRQKVLGTVCDAQRNQEAVEELMDSFNPKAEQEAEEFIEIEQEREEVLTEKKLLSGEIVKPKTKKKGKKKNNKVAIVIIVIILIAFLAIFFLTKYGFNFNLG